MNKLSCSFCSEEILKNQEIFREENISVLLPRSPVSRGHLLLVSNRHVDSLEKLTDKEIIEIRNLIKKIFEEMKKSESMQGYNLLNNCGACAGQHINHFHLHLIFRKSNENFSPLDVISKKIEKKEMTSKEWADLRNRFRKMFKQNLK